MATPPSASPPPSPSPISNSPAAAAAAAASPSTTAKKPQPIPWTHEETINLIQAYQDKWYSLKRGQLKSSQWEEVAVTVAARCGYDYTEPSKSATQCRHKMEKLRQRFRTEKQRRAQSGVSSWLYFDLMEAMERGPLPISARPMTALPYRHNQDPEEEEEDNDEEEDDDYDENRTKSHSIDYILKRPAMVNRFSGIGGDGFSAKRAREEVEDCEFDDFDSVSDRRREREREREVVLKLAAEIKKFSERFIGMESKKMEIFQETKRHRMEMENKMMDMIVKSEQKILDSIAKAFGS
ncbi:hypothetical protein UlMin_031854 [Ulmus minor]